MIHLKFKNKVKYLIGGNISPLPLEPFSKIVCEFLNDLSKLLMEDKISKKYPDLISFAFWCRYSNISKIKNSQTDQNIRIGKGVVFHITPSNLPINTLFSLVFGLLSGNSNIIKISNKKFEQIDLFILHFNKLVKRKKYLRFKNMISFIQYQPDSEITKYFSSIANVRMIWGGDNTIKEIKRIESKPRSLDLSFADRYSIGIINSDKVYLTGKKEEDKIYYRHTGYPGGIKDTNPKNMRGKNKSIDIIKLAIKRMIPKGPLGSKQLSNCKIFAGKEHSHTAQNPTYMDIGKLNSKNLLR